MPKGVYQRSDKELQRIRSLRKGLKPWNFGLTKETSEILRLNGIKIGIKKRQRPEPIRTKQWKNNISKALKGKPRSYQLKGELSPYWKGGLSYRKNLERVFGKEFIKGKIIHHIDGDHRNCSLDNLYIFPNQEEHVRYERKIITMAKKLLTGRISYKDFIKALEAKIDEFLP